MPKAKNYSTTDRDAELHYLCGEFHLQRLAANDAPIDDIEGFFELRKLQREIAAMVLAIHPETKPGRRSRQRVEIALLEDGAHPLVGDRR
jgi:hypothetical protein